MRLEAGFVRLLPMHELLSAADAADQKEAEQLLVATVHYDSSALRAHRRQGRQASLGQEPDASLGRVCELLGRSVSWQA